MVRSSKFRELKDQLFLSLLSKEKFNSILNCNSHLTFSEDGEILNFCPLKKKHVHIGKSPAAKLAVNDPLKNFDIHESIFSSTTSSGMTKFISNKGSAYIVNTEISEFMMKICCSNNKENYSG